MLCFFFILMLGMPFIPIGNAFKPKIYSFSYTRCQISRSFKREFVQSFDYKMISIFQKHSVYLI